MTDQKKIAILGWGSLIWRPGSLKKHIGEWQTGGPCLQIEFSRISRDGRLTLVIDGTNGETIPTRFAKSCCGDLHVSIEDLQEREGTGPEYIGFVGGDKKNEFPQSEVIQEWAERNKFDAVVWTALPPNFEKETSTKFSIEEAAKYIQNLKEPMKKNAREYIENAPPEVCTPLRRHLYATGWLKA